MPPIENQNSERRLHPLPKTSSDEIDLIEVLHKSVGIFSRHSRIIFAAGFIGLAIAAVVYFILPPTFTGTMVVNAPRLSYSEMHEIVNGYEKHLKNSSHPLHGIAKKIELVNQPSTDTDRSYVIKAVVSKPEKYAVVENHLIDAINTNPYVVNLLEVEREKTVEMIAALEIEEKKLNDVLNHTIKENLDNENFSVADIAKLKIDLTKQKTELRAKLASNVAASVVKNFEDSDIPSNKSLLQIFGVCLLASLLTCGAYIAYKELSEMLKNYEKEKLQVDTRLPINGTNNNIPTFKRTNYRPRVRQQ